MFSPKLFLWVGAAIFALGCILTWAPWTVNWFGRLPGDIRIEKENTFVFIPITSMVVVSAVLSAVAKFFFRQ